MAIMRRANFGDLVLEDALPALEEIINDTMEEFPLEHERIFNMRSMDRGIVQHTQTSGLPAVGQVAEGAEYQMDQMYQGYNTTFKAMKYGVIVPITEELLEDNQHDEAFDRAESLGRAMRESQRISGASIFNDAFTVLGPDAKPLCDVAHPLAYPGAGASSNRLAVDADLSLASLEDILTVMRKTRDNSGKKVLVRAKEVIVPAELEFTITELLDSTQKPQAAHSIGGITEQNAVNAVRSRYGLQGVVFDYLTDPDAFFVSAGKGSHKIYWYDRKKPQTSSDMEFKADVALMKVKARWALGYSDFRGIAGSAGA